MAVICPTVTAKDPHTYREQMARIEPFANRVHIDFADGDFAPTRLINPIQAYWPDGLTADLHIMYRRPYEQLETIISLKPSMAIIHAEAEGDLLAMLLELQTVGIKAGIALLADTLPNDHMNLINQADHVLLFGGNLGYQGGTANLSGLDKIADIRVINPTIEIGWDGGISAENAPELIERGIEVLNVGGFIHTADDPSEAYKKLTAAARES